MTPIKLSKQRLIDGERAFRLYWTDMGSARSIRKVVKQLPSNPNTNRPYYDMAVWFALYSWAIANIDLSYEIYSKAMMDEGKYHTKDEWEEFVQKNLYTTLKRSNRRFKLWLSRYQRKNLINVS